MNRLLMIILMILLPLRADAQAANPRNTFVNAVNINNPSVWLNFNEATTNFLDSVSGLTFNASHLSYNGSSVSGLNGGNSGGTIGVNAVAFSTGGTLEYIFFQSNGAAATTQTFLILSGTAPALTIASSFTATVAATPNQQVLVAGVNFTAPTVTAGEFLGNWVSSGTSVGYASGGTNSVYYLTGQATLPSGAETYGSASGSYAIVGAVMSASLASAQQPGFDSTNNGNYSAKFPYNQWNAAPNNVVSTIDWNTPWTMLLHVNKLNWDHAGNLVLASKGDLNGAAINNIWWELFVQQNSGNGSASQLCFSRNSPAPDTVIVGSTFVANQTWCSPRYEDIVPNGFNYNIVVEDNGTGSASAVSMWINGLAQGLVNVSTGNGFGGVTLAIAQGGSGYPASVSFTSTGGGANCTVSGTASSTGGVLSSLSVGVSSGCVSVPSLVLSSSSGSGAVLTATVYPMSMNSSIQPLMVPGFISNGRYYGPGGADTSENPVYIDEFAEFPGNLTFGQITNIFYETKFYQGLLYPGLQANPPLVVFEGYGCGPDFSGDQSLAMTIGAHKAGLIRLIGVEDDDSNANGQNSIGWWRQMLDQAGLADIPLSVGTNSPTANIGGCPAAIITAYNANTPQNASSYQSASTMYRTLFAKYSAQPIDVLMTQTANGYNSFQLSLADGISSLTGLQLQARNYTNGGWVSGFNGNLFVDQPYYNSVFSDIGTGPLYMWGGSPAAGGPGVLVSRTGNDPLYQVAAQMVAGDAATGWTNQNVTQMISPYFYGGVEIAVSGGTGYAANTPFTSVGGGPYCNVTGIMQAAGGIPAGMDTAWNAAVASTNDGIGYGCSPALFLGTASGVNLTVSAVNLGQIANGDTISGTGIPAGTTIVSQTSGTTGGAGVYVTSGATTASAATIIGTPTIVLTNPSGTGAIFTVTDGTFPQNYGGTGAGQYTVYSSQWSEAGSGSNAPIFTWFQNSLIDPPTTGMPKPY